MDFNIIDEHPHFLTCDGRCIDEAFEDCSLRDIYSDVRDWND